jgi:hypothetical protein
VNKSRGKIETAAEIGRETYYFTFVFFFSSHSGKTNSLFLSLSLSLSLSLRSSHKSIRIEWDVRIAVLQRRYAASEGIEIASLPKGRQLRTFPFVDAHAWR